MRDTGWRFRALRVLRVVCLLCAGSVATGMTHAEWRKRLADALGDES